MINTETDNIDVQGDGTPIQTFSITFPFLDPSHIRMWEYVLSYIPGTIPTLVEKETGVDFFVTKYDEEDSGTFGTLRIENGSIKKMRIQRFVENTNDSSIEKSSTTLGVEGVMDKTAMQVSQGLSISDEVYKNWSAKGDRIINLAEPSSMGDMATKKYVDGNIPGTSTGTPWSISSVNVGKFLKTDGSGGTQWGDISGYPEENGLMGAYLTPNGWKMYSDTPAPTSDDNYLLMDNNGSVEWSQSFEVTDPTTATASQVLRRTNDATPATYGWSRNGFLPMPAATKDGSYVVIDSVFEKNKWNEMRLVTGKAGVTFTGDYTGYTGSGGSAKAITDHRVWEGSFEHNIEVTPTHFFCVPSTVNTSMGHKSELWFNPNYDGTPGQPVYEWCPGGFVYSVDWAPSINLLTMTSTEITLTATSWFHTHYWWTESSGSDQTLTTFTHPSEITITINWFAIVPST